MLKQSWNVITVLHLAEKHRKPRISSSLAPITCARRSARARSIRARRRSPVYTFSRTRAPACRSRIGDETVPSSIEPAGLPSSTVTFSVRRSPQGDSADFWMIVNKRGRITWPIVAYCSLLPSRTSRRNHWWLPSICGCSCEFATGVGRSGSPILAPFLF